MRPVVLVRVRVRHDDFTAGDLASKRVRAARVRAWFEQAKATTNGRRGLVVFLSYLFVLPVTLLVAEVALLIGATTLAGASAVIAFGLGLFTVPIAAVAQGYRRAPDALSSTTGVVWHLTSQLWEVGDRVVLEPPLPCAVLHAALGSAVRPSASRGVRLHGRSGGCARARERGAEPGPLPLPAGHQRDARAGLSARHRGRYRRRYSRHRLGTPNSHRDRRTDALTGKPRGAAGPHHVGGVRYLRGSSIGRVVSSTGATTVPGSREASFTNSCPDCSLGDSTVHVRPG
ncbi:hypothetical protein BFL35_16370 (plasmid) [Clavibacter michiganensis]|nr:hypothetical protein BFL35_16370 [Clavibacter michiganensis]